MRYSGWTALLYASSAFKDMSEGLAGLERAMRLAGGKPPSGTVTPYQDFVHCSPLFPCRVKMSHLERTLRSLARTAGSSFTLALRIIDEAKANGIREFDVRLSGPVGPAPDREGDGARVKRPAPRRPRPRRPRPRPKRRAR